MIAAKKLLADAGFSLAFGHLQTWFIREGIHSEELQAELAAEVLRQTQSALEHLSRGRQRSVH